MMRGRRLDLLVALVFAVQLGAAAILVPASGGVALPGGRPLGGLCWLHAVTGHDCPLCGMTRSFVALAHGHLAAALAWHPGGPALFVVMAATVAAVVWALARRRPPVLARAGAACLLEVTALGCVALGLVRGL